MRRSNIKTILTIINYTLKIIFNNNNNNNNNNNSGYLYGAYPQAALSALQSNKEKYFHNTYYNSQTYVQKIKNKKICIFSKYKYIKYSVIISNE